MHLFDACLTNGKEHEADRMQNLTLETDLTMKGIDQETTPKLP